MDLPVVVPIKNMSTTPHTSARHFLLHPRAHGSHWHFHWRRVGARRWPKGKNLGICVFALGEGQQNAQEGKKH